MQKKRLSTMILGVTLLIGTTAFAYGGRSYAEISRSQAAVDGGNIPAIGNVHIYGKNESYSSHGLWSELYKSVAGPDIKKGGVFCYKNQSKSTDINVVDGTYYIHLDVDGPGYTGCTGYGYAKDN